jgi:hypothetical protein
MKIKKQPDLAKLITMLDEKNEGEGNQLSFTHATSISWKVMKGHKQGMKKKEIIKYVVNNLPILYVQPKDGNERKSKFSHDQIQRTISGLNEMLRWHWFPWSNIRKSLNRLCK